MKQIRLNVNIFFDVPSEYQVTDTESIEFVGEVLLKGEDGVLANSVAYHETIEAFDMNEFESGGF